jgi:hypothetical protein
MKARFYLICDTLEVIGLNLVVLMLEFKFAVRRLLLAGLELILHLPVLLDHSRHPDQQKILLALPLHNHRPRSHKVKN